MIVDLQFVQPMNMLHKKLIMLHKEPYVTTYLHSGDRVLMDAGEQEFRDERKERQRDNPLDRVGLANMVLMREQYELVFLREVSDLGLAALEAANQGLSWCNSQHQVCMDASRGFWQVFLEGNQLNNVTLKYLSGSTAPELADARRQLTYELMRRTPTAHAWILNMKRPSK